MAPQIEQGDTAPRQNIHIKEIRELAKRFTPEELEGCIQHQLEEGTNPCDSEDTAEETINVLAKAEYVRHLVDDKGLSLGEAIRELGRRVRSVQQGSEP